MANSKNNIDAQLAELLDLSEGDIGKAIDRAKEIVSFDGKQALKDLMTQLKAIDPSTGSHDGSLEITTSDVEETYVKSETILPLNKPNLSKPLPPALLAEDDDSIQHNIAQSESHQYSNQDPNEISGVFNELREEQSADIYNEGPADFNVDQTVADQTESDQTIDEDVFASNQPEEDVSFNAAPTYLAPDLLSSELQEDSENSSDPTYKAEVFSEEQTFIEVGDDEHPIENIDDEDIELDDSDFIEIEDDFEIIESDSPPSSQPHAIPLPPELGMSALDADQLTDEDVGELTSIHSSSEGLDSFVDIPDDDFDIDMD